MLRLYDADAAVAMDSTNTTGPGVVPFDGLLDYWPLPGQSKDGGPRAARLLVGVGSEVVGPNAFVAVEVFVNGKEVSVCVGVWYVRSCTYTSEEHRPTDHRRDMITSVCRCHTSMHGHTSLIHPHARLTHTQDTPILGLLDTGAQASVLNAAAAAALGLADKVVGASEPFLFPFLIKTPSRR